MSNKPDARRADPCERGRTTGQGSNGFGSPWWVVSPAGKAIAN
jgi:hypothetical protein